MADGVACTLSTIHYMVDGSVGVNQGFLRGIRFAFDTGAGFNLIRRNALPFGWEKKVDHGATAPQLRDASGRPLDLREVVWLTTRLGNAFYRIRYIVAERLAVAGILGTGFMNVHVDAIRCREQRIDLQKGSVPA